MSRLSTKLATSMPAQVLYLAVHRVKCLFVVRHRLTCTLLVCSQKQHVNQALRHEMLMVSIMDFLARPAVRVQNEDFATEQWKDQINNLLEHGKLPVDGWRAQQIALQKPIFTMKSGILFYIDPKQDHHK